MRLIALTREKQNGRLVTKSQSKGPNYESAHELFALMKKNGIKKTAQIVKSNMVVFHLILENVKLEKRVTQA